MSERPLEGRWALILGASSGFGAATGKALAAQGMNIAGVHLDLRATLPQAKAVIADIESQGVKALFFNTNAADPDKRGKILQGCGRLWGRTSASTSSCIRSPSAR